MPRDHAPDTMASRSPGAVARLLAALACLILFALGPAALAGVPGVSGAPSSGRDGAARPVALLPESAVTFHASDAFGGFDGRAPIDSFSMMMDPQDLATTQVHIDLKSDAVTTGNFLRDVNASRTVFEASQYPTISYRVDAVDAQPSSLADGGAAAVTVDGTLRMHGVERAVVARGRVTRSGNGLEATLAMQVRLSDFDMTAPRFFTVVVDDVIQVRVHLFLRMQTASSG